MLWHLQRYEMQVYIKPLTQKLIFSSWVESKILCKAQ